MKSFNIDQEINLMLTSLETSQEISEKRVQLRCSSLPWCGLHSFFFEEGYKSNFASDFYTSIGTAVHESMQKWMAKDFNYSSDIYATWVCESCREEHVDCYHPKTCRKCKSEKLKYKEIEINYKSLSGHVDLIRRINDEGHCIVIDFKTTDLFKDLKSKGFNWNKDFQFSKKYLIQIRTYCALLRKIKGLDIRGWCLLFVDRSAPPSSKTKPKIVYEKWTPKLNKEYMGYVDALEENWQTYQELEKAIKDEDREEALGLIKELIVNRPCYSPEDYNDWMSAKFFNPVKDGCPAAKVCTKKSNKDILKFLLAKLESKANE
jgi:hypothetical protein